MIVIRPEQPPDVPVIHALTREAFREAAHTDHNEPFIVDGLRAEGALSISLVAERAGTLVGHVALSPVTVGDGTARGWYGLGPISVLPASQRKGVGSALMHAALDALRDLGASGCVLLGDPGYYARFGFVAQPELVLPGVPAEYFQALQLGDERAEGVVRYHAAFEATA